LVSRWDFYVIRIGAEEQLRFRSRAGPYPAISCAMAGLSQRSGLLDRTLYLALNLVDEEGQLRLVTIHVEFTCGDQPHAE
jgi:hypothetical protein